MRNIHFRLPYVAKQRRLLKGPNQNPTPWPWWLQCIKVYVKITTLIETSGVDTFVLRFVLQRQVSDIHVVCGLLKDFLRNLAEPLLTYELWSKFVDAASKLINVLRLVILSFTFQLIII